MDSKITKDNSHYGYYDLNSFLKILLIYFKVCEFMRILQKNALISQKDLNNFKINN